MLFASYIDRFERKQGKKKSGIVSEFISTSGTPYVPKYEYQVIDGIKQLVKCGEINIQDKINSFVELSDINVIIARWLNGDDTVLNKVVGQFGDFTNCPTTYAEMYQRLQECENLFMSLPVDIREKFDNSTEKFWSEFGSDYFNSVFEDFSHTENVSDNSDNVAPSVDNVGNEVNK